MEDACCVRQGNPFGNKKHRSAQHKVIQRKKGHSQTGSMRISRKVKEFKSQQGHCGALCQ